MPPSPAEPKTEKETRNRVRDNQRRSRARRKEYLHDLEQRLRQAEQHGIQASTAIQAAARQVAEENRRLRLLLRHHGVSDASIESYLAAASPNVAGGASGAMTSGAAQRLDRLLNPTSAASSPRIPPGSQLSTTASTSTNSTCAPPSPASPRTADDNNCAMAADLISTMTGVNPHEVRTSLGCTPGMDCHVDNNRIGDAIEQFTESGVVT